MARSDANVLHDRWFATWNGGPALAGEIVAPGRVVHQAPFGPGEPPEFRGPGGVAHTVALGRGPSADPALTARVWPTADDSFACRRWLGQGTYRGGIPPGGGSDRLRRHRHPAPRRRQGRQYRVKSDGAHLTAHIGIS